MGAMMDTLFGRLATFLMIAAMALLTACSDSTSPGAAVSGSAAPAGPIAFEPITGLPDSRAAELAAALGQRATAKNLIVVSRDDSKLRYRIKGYFDAQPSAERTTVAFIWDVFDKDGTRVHRFDGTQNAPKGGASDPWGAVTPEVIDGIADYTTSELARFLATVSTTQASLIRPTSNANAIAFTGSVPRNVMPAKPKYFVASADSNISDGRTALPAALARALAEDGVQIAGSQAEADVIVSAETAIAPAEKGRQRVAIVWTAKTASGSGIGSVQQVTEVLQDTLSHGWGLSAESAADAASPALIELVRGS